MGRRQEESSTASSQTERGWGLTRGVVVVVAAAVRVFDVTTGKQLSSNITHSAEIVEVALSLYSVGTQVPNNHPHHHHMIDTPIAQPATQPHRASDRWPSSPIAIVTDSTAWVLGVVLALRSVAWRSSTRTATCG